MHVYETTHPVAHSAEAMFALVANVEDYPKFLRAYLRGEEAGVAAPSTSVYEDGRRQPRLAFNLLHRQRV